MMKNIERLMFVKPVNVFHLEIFTFSLYSPILNVLRFPI